MFLLDGKAFVQALPVKVHQHCPLLLGSPFFPVLRAVFLQPNSWFDEAFRIATSASIKISFGVSLLSEVEKSTSNFQIQNIYSCMFILPW